MSSVESKTYHRAALEIRDFQPEDYPAIADIANLVYPEHPTTVEEMRFDDEHFDRTRYLWRRYVAVDAATRSVVAEAEYEHTPWSFHSQRFQVWIAVHPRWQRKGIGGLLYDHLLQELRGHRVNQLRTWSQETMADTLGFLERRGFRELMRSWESRLDVRAFDATPFGKYWGPPAGIEIVTLAEELRRDPDCLHRVYDLGCDLAPDVPRIDPFTPSSFDMWRDHAVGGPRALPEAFFLAMDGDEYVGQSDVARSEQLPDVLYTGFTGVRRAFRGRGVAFALKLRAIDYARRHGYREIRTWNSTLNAPMLGINVRLGFVKQPVWITFGLDVAEGA